MKTIIRILGTLFGATALFLSCTKQENPVCQEGNTFEMTVVAGSDQTRTVLGSDGSVTWSATGEQLAVMEAAVSNSTTTTAKVTSSDGVTADGGATMTFGVSMTSKTADSFGYYALYPNSAYVDTPSDFANVKVKLATTQAPTEYSFGPSADVLVAKPVIGLTDQPTELNLQFARVIAVGKMTIKNLNTSENVKKVTFTAAGKAVTGRSYIDFTTAAGVEYGYSGQGVDNVILDYSDKTIAANGMTAVFTCWPFELAAGETFSVVVETENYTFTKDITLAEGKSLAFNVGRASAFNVNFDGIEGIKKGQLVEDGAYVVAYTTNMMTVGTASNKYRDVATMPKTANEDASYSVDATAAWNFVYDSATDTYKISSASDNTLYLQGSSTASDFILVAEADATSFSITKKDDGTFKIGITSGSNTRYIGYNTQAPRFAMYAGSTNQPVDLNLYPAKVVILPKIGVQETLSVPSAETTSSFPVTLTNVETAEVNVYKDAACTTVENEWITAGFNTEKTAVEYMVSKNTTSEARTAYIKIYVRSSDATEATAIVTVTQGVAGSSVVLYTLDATGTLKGTNNSYTGNCDIVSGDITWNVTGNTTLNPWRIGGKSLTNVDREVYTKTSFSNALTSIDVTFGTASSITVNSCKIVYSTSADFSNSKEVVGTFAASSTVKFEAEYPAKCYYKLILNVTVTSSKSNGYVQLSKIEFIGNN